MHLTYSFQGILPQAKCVAQLNEFVRQHGKTLIEQTEIEKGSDFHFFAPGSNWKGLTGLKIAVGPGWTAELVKKERMKVWLREEQITPEVGEMLVDWALERKQVRGIRPLRHELGNLVVIFLARIDKLRGIADADNLDKLENLHQRLDELYRRFESITIF